MVLAAIMGFLFGLPWIATATGWELALAIGLTALVAALWVYAAGVLLRGLRR